MTDQKERKFASAALITLSASTMLSGTAFAQETDQSGGLVEIVVTAERRTQNLQDVPISATVLTADDLQARGVTNLNALQQVAPSVAINTVGRSTFINIRGVGIAQSAPTSSPGVAYYLDGVLIPHEMFIGQSFYDIGSIEVLRGPQGTLTGQNSTGGAVYVRTPEPKFDNTSGFGELTYGNYDRLRGVAAINLSEGENVALRIAYTHDERDSYTRNIGPSPSTPGNLNLDSGRINLAMRTTDEKLRVNVRGEYFDYKTGNLAVKRRGDVVSTDPYVIQEDGISYLNQSGYRISGDARYAILDEVDARVLVSWQDGSVRDQADGDRSATALAIPANLPASAANRALFPGRVSRARTDFNTLIAEANLLSTGEGPFSWVVGGFMLDEDVPVQLLRDNYSRVNFVRSNSTTNAVAHNESRSIFGQANWYVTPQLELLAGGRYSWDSQDFLIKASVGNPVPVDFTKSTESKKLTGKLGINYHMDNGTLLYATASRGYKAGGVNLTTTLVSLPTDVFKPESNTVYEVGVKTELFDRHLRINADVFKSEYKNIQLISLLNGLPLTQNAASGKSWGAELEVTAQFGGFAASFGAGYLDAQFAQNTCINDGFNPVGNPLCHNNVPTTPGNQLVPKGRVLPYAPKWTINAGMEYAIPLGGDLSLTPRAQWSHTAKQVATPFPGVNADIGARDIIDLRLRLDFGDKYSLEGYIDNVTDEIYVQSQFGNSSSANGGILYGSPQTYGVRAVVKFGG